MAPENTPSKPAEDANSDADTVQPPAGPAAAEAEDAPGRQASTPETRPDARPPKKQISTAVKQKTEAALGGVRAAWTQTRSKSATAVQRLDAGARLTRLGQRTSVRTGRLARKATAGGGRAATSVQGFVAGTVWPVAVKTGAWIGRQLSPITFGRRWRSAVAIFHERILDRQIEKQAFERTRPRARLDDLMIVGPNKAHGYDYQVLPSRLFDWIFAVLPDDVREYTFVDYGAGRGRVLLLASQLNFDKIVGVEFAEELHSDAQLNVAQFPRSLMKCRDVECLLRDAADLPVPAGPSVLYFFDPFDQTVMKQVLNAVTTSYKAEPRRIYCIYVGPRHAELFDQSEILNRVKLPIALKLKVQLLSPYSVRIYRTIV